MKPRGGAALHPGRLVAIYLVVRPFLGWVPSLLAISLLVACGGDEKPASTSTLQRPAKPGVRVSMAALHAMGGTPPGWQLTLPPGTVDAGRQAFVDFGCESCHLVAGEPFAKDRAPDAIGPELTGMGAHHPPGYFAEAILNPDAILVDGPDYIGRDGRSVMPTYPEMTLTQLADIVAYLSSLTSGGAHAHHAAAGAADPHAGHDMSGGGMKPANVVERPTPPATGAKSFFVQSYDIQPGKLAAFEDWFQKEGAKQFLAYDGLVSIDTYVDSTRIGNTVTSVFGFRDDEALNRFMNEHDPKVMAIGDQFDAFVGPHDHKVFRNAPIYRAPALSAP